MIAAALRTLVVLCCINGMYGCAYSNVNAYGAKALVDETFEVIDLVDLLGKSEEKNPAAAPGSQQPVNSPSSSSGQSATAGTAESRSAPSFNEAFRAFYGDTAKGDLRLRRNMVQERILAASVQRCGNYVRFLKQFDTEIGFSLGSLATTLAGVGAIVTPANAARALSGTAGITTGINAEFQQQFFSKLAMQVITKGIEARRAALYKEMVEKQAKAISEYPVEAAVKDALMYHNACTLLTGLEEAGASIERASNPGIAQLNEFFKANPVMKRLILGEQGSGQGTPEEGKKSPDGLPK